MNTEEKWVQDREYEMYEVSNHGRIRRIATGRILKTGYTHGKARKYLKVNLRKDGATHSVMLHRRVAIAHVPAQPSAAMLEVNHDNGNKHDCAASNLLWETRQGNVAHAWRTGLCKRRAA